METALVDMSKGRDAALELATFLCSQPSVENIHAFANSFYTYLKNLCVWIEISCFDPVIWR